VVLDLSWAQYDGEKVMIRQCSLKNTCTRLKRCWTSNFTSCVSITSSVKQGLWR